jgi:glycosyltransferase involved in cell wall biosynthesis
MGDDTDPTMRVVYVNKMWPVHDGGGGEVRLWEIARRLARRGHDVTIVCGRSRAGLPSSTTVEGVRIETVRVLPELLFRLRGVSFFLARYLFYLVSRPAIARAARQAEVLMDCATPVASDALPVARRARRPCAVTVYETFGGNWFRLRGPVTALLGYLGERRLLGRTYDAYVTLSPETAKDLLAHGVPPERLHLVTAGAGVERAASRSARPRAGTRRLEVVCVSRLVPQKNLASLLRAWRIVLAGSRAARLRIIGEGTLRPKLEALARRLGIADSVVFEGFLAEEQKWHALDTADVFAFPSRREGWGLALLEAELAGLPVVAYDLSVFRAFVTSGREGFLVPPGDEPGFARALVRLLDEPELRATMGAAAAERAGTFTWDRAALEEEQILTGLVETSR